MIEFIKCRLCGKEIQKRNNRDVCIKCRNKLDKENDLRRKRERAGKQ